MPQRGWGRQRRRVWGRWEEALLPASPRAARVLRADPAGCGAPAWQRELAARPWDAAAALTSRRRSAGACAGTKGPASAPAMAAAEPVPSPEPGTNALTGKARLRLGAAPRSDPPHFWGAAGTQPCRSGVRTRWGAAERSALGAIPFTAGLGRRSALPGPQEQVLRLKQGPDSGAGLVPLGAERSLARHLFSRSGAGPQEVAPFSDSPTRPPHPPHLVAQLLLSRTRTVRFRQTVGSPGKTRSCQADRGKGSRLHKTGRLGRRKGETSLPDSQLPTTRGRRSPRRFALV